METILIAFISSVGMLLIVLKSKWKKHLLHYDYVLDIIFTLIFPLCFAGSFQGMAVGFLAGVFISIQLMLAKRMIGSEPLPFIERIKRKLKRKK